MARNFTKFLVLCLLLGTIQGVKLDTRVEDPEVAAVADDGEASVSELRKSIKDGMSQAEQEKQKLEKQKQEKAESDKKQKKEHEIAKRKADALEKIKKESSEKAQDLSTEDHDVSSLAQDKAEINKKSNEMVQTDDQTADKDKKEEVKKEEVKQEDNGFIKVKEMLKTLDQGSFVSELISRPDGLRHLLLSDVNKLLFSIQNDFPEITKVYSIGKSFEGRDINVIELNASGMEEAKPEKPAEKEKPKKLAQEENADPGPHAEDAFIQVKDDEDDISISGMFNSMKQKPDDEVKKTQPKSTSGQNLAESSSTESVEKSDKPAILQTGATHARELISTSLNIYQLLTLLQKGAVQRTDKWAKLLDSNKYYFIPILNVDGVAFIEKNWQEQHKIVPDRKNMNGQNGPCAQSLADDGVDINRNFAVDFGQVDEILDYQPDNWLEKKSDKGKNRAVDPCSTNYAGPKPFSEPESIAFRDFLVKHKDELSFVINTHSNGNAFIYPFNGRQKNDIEERRPGILKIFTQIADKANFPYGTMKGTSKEVMGQAIGGDQDDWTLAELGIPSVTNEVGFVGQFIDEWQVKDASTANDIMQEQAQWINYTYEHLADFDKIVRNQPAQKPQSTAQKSEESDKKEEKKDDKEEKKEEKEEKKDE